MTLDDLSVGRTRTVGDVMKVLRRTIRTIGRVLDAMNRLLGRIAVRRRPEVSDTGWSGGARSVVEMRAKEH